MNTLSVAVVTWFGSATALAAEGVDPVNLAHPKLVWASMFAALIMFGLLFFLLKKMAWGLIVTGLDDREVKIRTEIEQAENAKVQANSALDKYQKELANARAEATQMIQQAKADAQTVANELRTKNESELNAMKKRAKDDIESAKRAALSEIYNEVATISTQIAGKILEREIKAEDHTKLVNDSLAQLGSLKNTTNN